MRDKACAELRAKVPPEADSALLLVAAACAAYETLFSPAAPIIFCVDIMPATQPSPPPVTLLPNAGIPGPVPDNFDFGAFLTIPNALTNLEIPLASRIAKNAQIEDFNNASISITATVKATSPRPDDMDVGPALKPPYSYSTGEMQELIQSEALCAAVGPLPVSLVRVIEAERANAKKKAELDRQAEKEKETDNKARSKLLGTMRLDNPIERVMARAEDVDIPTVYLLGILNKCCPPLNFFTNERLKIVKHSPQNVHMKLVRPWGMEDGAGEKVQLLDVPKMITSWGTDDSSSCLTPLRFLEASSNLLKALYLLAAPRIDPDDTTYAIEYEKHRDFFAQLDDFEETYPHWYKFELKARREILQGVRFNWREYALEVTIVQRARELLSTSAGPSFKRSPDDGDSRITKVPRQSFRSDAPTSRVPDFFREGGPACLLCGRGHRYRDHPNNISSFEDGKPLFCRLDGNSLYTKKPFKGSTPKRICTVWNITRKCDGRHGGDCLHSCSLCGNEHSALERHPACARVRDGKFYI